MSRGVSVLLAAALCALPLAAQKDQSKQPELKQRGKDQKAQPPSGPVIEQAPPEEDESLAVKEYSFNPLQATKELQIGNFYFKKGSYRAAAQRFREATKWNNGYAEAWLRLGEVEEKQKDSKAAKEAFSKYLELEPDAKNAAEIRKKLSKLHN
ncbi:MAG TPA: tetratricopeptide repeat protein [Bryobacteraceae bacterium]|nr:tetratricopeptide repeat protein [Bryobacteraceae bacterium]